MKQQSQDWSYLERGARHRLVAIGLPHQWINPLVDLVFRWVRASGPEWTVSRLKQMKLSFLHRKAEVPFDAPWIRKNSQGLPSGVFGSMMRWCNDRGSRKGSFKRFNTVLQSLNISSLFTNSDVTSSQMEKFMAGVSSTEPDNLTVEWLYEYTSHVMGLIPHQLVKRGSNDLLSYVGSPSKRAPMWHSDKGVRQTENILSEMEYANGQENYVFAWEYNELYAPVVAGIRGPLVRKTVQPDKRLYGGEVHFLQEPGLKLRAIASPYRIHQLALKPLGQAIYSVVRGCKWDCTFDQTKAMPWIQKSLSDRKTVHSIDLTGATDYFPLGLQLETLRSIFGDLIDIRLVAEISRLPFKSSKGDIQWKRGQPLGLYPSFGMFTLTHGLVLSFLLKKLGQDYNHQFFVVGDDVVILDDQLYSAYIDFLDMTKCPWSPSKSISSKVLAEFAGNVVTESNVVPSYKWRKVSNENFLDICKNLGPRSAVLLTKAQKQVFDSVKHLVGPVGLNFSYEGSSLYKMIVATDRFMLDCEKHAMRSLVDLTSVIHRNSYGSITPYALEQETVSKLKETFDEKVFKVFQQTVFKRCEAFWHMVADIPQALGLSPSLPIEGCSGSRISTLLRYQRLIGNQ